MVGIEPVDEDHARHVVRNAQPVQEHRDRGLWRDLDRRPAATARRGEIRGERGEQLDFDVQDDWLAAVSAGLPAARQAGDRP